jgi:predicted MPP superfamily phosphohydrolase
MFFLLSSISFILTTLVTQASYTKIGSILYKLDSIWLGTIYMFFLASVLFILFYATFSFLNLSLSTPKIIGVVLFLISILMSVYGVFRSFDIKVTNYTVQIKNLPESWSGKNIVLFSDTHFGNIRNLKFGERLVSRVNEQNSNAVIIAGDFYDGPSVNAKEVALLLKDIKTEKGIYFASGNHEEYGDHNLFIESLLGAGVEVLDNKSILVDGINIVGLDYASGSSKKILDDIFNGLDLQNNNPKILIKHAPSLLHEVEKYKFDLVVSGHVHSGQVWHGMLFAKTVFNRFSYGLNHLNEMAVVTSSGAGTWGPPQRLGTKSEIVVIKLLAK